MKDYLNFENSRNKRNAHLYRELIQRAIGKVEVLIGHHLTFEQDGNLETENEIPSADTLMFDHDIMTAVFGDRAVSIMQHLAATPCDSRDIVLGEYMAEQMGEGIQVLNMAETTPAQWMAAIGGV